ncbi:glycosyltransferase family 2 protein [bacterium]|nr:glycosyltransferase family 2 protein [bacterium]NDD84238.1 glycosyltransferase family 2 protein [bacterium]NDG31425.1 glycosyltransferase family 2 protein [bacterium]
MYYIVNVLLCVIVLFLVFVCRQVSMNVYSKDGIAIACLMRKPIDLPLWLKHHRNMGVTHFFIRLEDSPGFEDILNTQKDVYLEIGQSDQHNNYTTLQTRQINFVNKCIHMCNIKGIKWIFHIDADELLHGDLSFLYTLDPQYQLIRMENAEALFDKNQKHCFHSTQFLRCSLNAPCRSYVNGKGGGRVSSELGIAGPHHFSYKSEYIGDFVYEAPFQQLGVLHFDSCSFGAWVEKFHHLGKQNGDNIPFPYYRESIESANQAFKVYSNKTHSDVAKNLPKHIVWKKD